jgi:CheY-like chemotaxis protein/nitrogen-specific signal transduction histidine kinase
MTMVKRDRQNQKMKVLVVDDSPTIRAIIREKLSKGGYEVLEAIDGADALRQVVANHGAIDLITLDVEMPVMDGFRTCAELNKEKYQTVFKSRKKGKLPVLFVTSQDTLGDRKKGFELGATDFIGKEFLENEILTRVDKILKPSSHLEDLCALVVEDSSTYRLVVVEALQREGVSVEQAENGAEAYVKIVANPRKYDIIITDLEMPEMDGIQLVDKLRNEMGMMDLPVIILSAINSKVTQLDLFKAGASDYITKPFIKEELLARLRVHLESRLMTARLKESLLEVKKLNDNLEKSKEEVERQSNERRELLHVLCHDLANPIASVIGVMDILKVSSEMEDIKQEAEKTLNNGLDIISLVRQLRALEDNKTELRLADANLKYMAMESVSMLDQRIEQKKIKVSVDIDDSLDVFVEPTSFLNSVMNNLITNAVKFSFDKSEISINAYPSGKDNIVLEIEDSGVGMSNALLRDIFDVNKATSRPGTKGELGTGFGMPLVKKFVNAYGGEIEVFSKDEKTFPEDHGTLVKVLLKAARDE